MSDVPTMILPPVGPPPGPDPHRRRPWRAALIAALVTLVLAVPAAIILLLRANHDNGSGPAAAPSAPPASSPAPPAPATSPGSPASPGRPAPDGRIALSTLQNSTLVIPAWPADNVQGPSGPLRFRNGVVRFTWRPEAVGHPPYGQEILLPSAFYGDVDRDGADETIADVECVIEGGSSQLVAFDRDRQDRIVTLGRVVATTGPIRDIRPDTTRVSAGGVVSVRVGDFQNCCGDETPVRWQTRGYGWRHGRFEQVSGSTVMPLNPSVTQTRISAGDLVLGPARDGYRTGTVTVTVRHAWGVRPGKMLLTFYKPQGLEPTGTAWGSTTVRGDGSVAVTVAAPPSHGTAVYRFAFRRPATATGGTLTVESRSETATGRWLSEAVSWDDGAQSAIRTVN